LVFSFFGTKTGGSEILASIVRIEKMGFTQVTHASWPLPPLRRRKLPDPTADRHRLCSGLSDEKSGANAIHLGLDSMMGVRAVLGAWNSDVRRTVSECDNHMRRIGGRTQMMDGKQAGRQTTARVENRREGLRYGAKLGGQNRLPETFQG